MQPTILSIGGASLASLGWAALGAASGAAFWLLARPRRKAGMPLRFLAAIAAAWVAVCLGYGLLGTEKTFSAYLLTSTLATKTIAAVGTLFYLRGLLRFRWAERRWRQSSNVLAGVALMGTAFVRAAYQPEVALWVQAPLAMLFIATVWRFRAEPLVYLSILGVAVTIVLGVRNHLAADAEAATGVWVTSTAAAVSLAMVLVAALLACHPRQEFNIKWYRQGLLIVPLVVSSLAAMGTGYVAVWYGASWHTVWSLGVWWATLLASSAGLKQADLFGFSCVSAALTAVVAFAVLGGGQIGGYWGRYASVLVLIAFGAAVLASLLVLALKGRTTTGFPRALFLAGVATAVGALLLEPFGTTAKYMGVDLLVASAVVVLAHAHGAPRWVNYVVAALATGGVVALCHVGPDAGVAVWHQRFIHVAAAVSVGWLVVAILAREVLKRTHSDRLARREIEPFTVLGMCGTLALAGYLSVQQVRTYSEFLTRGASATVAMLGPDEGLVGWLGILLAFLLSMWLLRHTARTFLFYCVGIMATVYAGLFRHTDDLYAYLIYSVGGYGAAHLLVYLYEAKFMALLSRTCALYRDERRASTTIFTLAVISCFIAAILAMFRVSSTESLIMLGLMAVVFLGWSFVWLRGEMLYPAVFMVTLTILAIWHNTARPTQWDPHRLNMNALVMSASALVWLGFGNRLHAIRGEIFQLATPARACSVILGMVGIAFAVALALSPTFGADAWRQPRALGDWAMGLATLSALILYFAWAAFVFDHRFYSLMSGVGVLLLGLYVGIYVGVRLAGG
ncbi:MAG TPA: hypothetical protein VM238_19300 [Phycisphaerae bacterium]|nr:hypothetical protein [Phycisphaerae bacterium]